MMMMVMVHLCLERDWRRGASIGTQPKGTSDDVFFGVSKVRATRERKKVQKSPCLNLPHRASSGLVREA